MATVTERYKALHAQTLTKLEEAMAAIGPDYTLPGGVKVDRMAYIKKLEESLEALEKKPGVVPEVAPVFEVFG